MLVASVSSVLAAAGVLGAEVLLARGTQKLPDYSREELEGRLGSGSQTPLRVAWLGDSTGQGIGATSLDHVLPRVVAAGLGRPAELSVLATSGARAEDALQEQLPLLRDLSPEMVFVCIGGNDVIHLTSRKAFRLAMSGLLAGIQALQPRHIIVVGIGQFASTPLFAQPLRWIAGRRGAALNADVRHAAAQAGAVYVGIIERVGEEFVRDPARYHASDRFHPSDDGYALWARAILEELEHAGWAPRRAPSFASAGWIVPNRGKTPSP